MENRSHALMTGFFTIALLIAAVLFGMWFNRDQIERVPYLVSTTLSVPGLNAQAAVRYRGLDVGKVDVIDFDPRKAGQILVHLSVNPNTPITTTTYAKLGYQGVTGIAYVQLDDDEVGAPLLATSASNPAQITLRPSLLDELETRGQVILDQAEQMTRNLNQLLSPTNQKTMLAAFEDVSRSAKQFGLIEQRLGPTLEQLPALTAQAQQSLQAFQRFSQDASRLSNNWNALGTRLQVPGGPIDRVVGTIDRVGVSVEAVAGDIELETLPHVIQLTDEMRSSMRVLRNTMNGLNERPQSILFGAPGVPPGPGEAGFVAPTQQGSP